VERRRYGRRGYHLHRLVTAGVGLGPVLARGVIVPAGIITTTIGSGPTTTGTYKHYLRYRPLGTGITVTAAF
jgi:hypothetical protein